MKNAKMLPQELMSKETFKTPEGLVYEVSFYKNLSRVNVLVDGNEYEILAYAGNFKGPDLRHTQKMVKEKGGSMLKFTEVRKLDLVLDGIMCPGAKGFLDSFSEGNSCIIFYRRGIRHENGMAISTKTGNPKERSHIVVYKLGPERDIETLLGHMLRADPAYIESCSF
jgi:hypothetical protein